MQDIDVIKAIDENEKFRFMIINSTDLVEEMRQIHNTSSTATAALGRLVTAVAMLGTDIKNENESLAIKIKGDGPAGLLIAESQSNGDIRAYIDHPEADVPNRLHDHKLDVGTLVGKKGILSFIRDFGTSEPYIGQTNLISGEIAEDIAGYYFNSEQTATVVSLGVLIVKDGSCKSAGGLFIQALPGCEESDLIKLEKCLDGFPGMSELFDSNDSEVDLLEKYFSILNLKILENKSIRYRCTCSQERVESALISLGKKQLNEILIEDQQAEIVCQYCNKKYQFTDADLKSFIEVNL